MGCKPVALRIQLVTPHLVMVGQGKEAAGPWAGRIRRPGNLELGTPGWGSMAGSAGLGDTLEEQEG